MRSEAARDWTVSLHHSESSKFPGKEFSGAEALSIDTAQHSWRSYFQVKQRTENTTYTSNPMIIRKAE